LDERQRVALWIGDEREGCPTRNVEALDDDRRAQLGRLGHRRAKVANLDIERDPAAVTLAEVPSGPRLGSSDAGWYLHDRATADLVEIGFGSGLNVPLYPPSVRRVHAVEPSSVGRRLAAKRVARSPVPVEFVGLDGQDLPLGDESVDAALSTFTLCTIPDAGR